MTEAARGGHRRAIALGAVVGVAFALYIGPTMGLTRRLFGAAVGAGVWAAIGFLPLMYRFMRQQEMPPALALGVAAVFTALMAGFMWLFNL